MGEHVNRVFVAGAVEIVERLRKLRSERGQTFVEYALLLLLVAVAITAAVDWGGFLAAIQKALTSVENKL